MYNTNINESESVVSGDVNNINNVDLEYYLAKQGLRLKEIPRVFGTDPNELRSTVIRHNSPAIFKGLINHWTSYRNWTPESLAKAYGQKQITALINLPNQGVFFPKDQCQYEQQMTLSEFVSLMLSTSGDRPCYLAYKRTQELFSTQDYNFEELLGDLNVTNDTRVWVGSAGTRSMLHSDLKDNLFCQIWGKKKVVLIPWIESVSAYPCLNNIVNSRLDLANFDLKNYPKLKNATLYTATMEPGDMLFMPRGWWHDIRSQTPSISLNHWFGPSLCFHDYGLLILRLGFRCWWAIAKDFIYSGLLSRRENRNFFYSPPSTGKRLYDLFRSGDFSKENDPETDET